jgi:hypothetical protein
MRHWKLLLVIAVTGWAFAHAKADDANEPLGVNVTMDYFSKYIWRGQNINDKSVLQPSIYLTKYGFTGAIWGNYDLTNVNGDRNEFTEIDYSLDYSNAVPGIEGINYIFGIIHCAFPDTEFEATTELYGGLSFTSLPLTPTIKINRDIDEIKGSYIQFSIGHTFEKVRQWSDTCYCNLQLGASTAYGTSKYNQGYFDVNSGRLNDLTLYAALPICLEHDWTVKPSLNYSTMLSDTIRQATDKSDNFWFGLSVSKSF